MRTRKIMMTLTLLFATSATFLSGCGAPAANNTTGNQNAAKATGNANTAANTTAEKASSTCTPQDDRQIEAQIRVLIDGDPVLYAHRGHINFATTICEVKLRGWIDTYPNFQNLYAKVKNAGGVRSIDIANFRIVGAAEKPIKENCTGGTVQCGELCIPSEERCTIPGTGGGGSGVTTPTPTPKP